MAVDCAALLEDGACFYCLGEDALDLAYGGMLVLLADFLGTNSDLQTALDDAGTAGWTGKTIEMYWAAQDHLWLLIAQVTDPTIPDDPCERLFDNPCLTGRTAKQLKVILLQQLCDALVTSGVVADCTAQQYLTAGAPFNSLSERDRQVAYLSILCGIATATTGASPCATDADLFDNNPWNCRCCGPTLPKVWGAIAAALSVGGVATSSFRLLDTDGTSFRLLEDGTSKRLIDV